MDCTEKFIHLLDVMRNKGDFRSAVELGCRVRSLYTQKVTNMRTGKNKVTVDILEDFLKEFPRVNAGYFFRDGEPMFVDEPLAPVGSPDSLLATELARERKRCEEKDKQILKLIELTIDGLHKEKNQG